MENRRPMSSILSYARTVLALAVCAAMNLALAAPAQVRYVSSEGDDSSDGLSESTPWRTLRKLSEGLPAGGTGLLRRGDVFYGQLKVPAGPSPDTPTAIDAYGTGPAPEVCGYKIPKRDAGVWKQVGDKLWQIDLSDHSLFDGNHDTADGNVGFLLVDGRFFGRKSSYKKKQTPSEQWGFVDDYKCLTVWSEEGSACPAANTGLTTVPPATSFRTSPDPAFSPSRRVACFFASGKACGFRPDMGGTWTTNEGSR